MPWKESRIFDQRLQFLSSYQKEEISHEHCRLCLRNLHALAATVLFREIFGFKKADLICEVASEYIAANVCSLSHYRKKVE